MAKNDQQEAYEKLLSATLSRTIDFVKFAEAKNAALLTFSSAWILASVNLSATATSTGWRQAFGLALPLFVVSALISILSFLPQIKLAKFHRDPSRAKSLLFFGDAAEFSPESYRDRMAERYTPPENESATKNQLDDLAVQINVNSKIAVRKFRIFAVGAWIALSAIGILVVPALIGFWASLPLVYAAAKTMLGF
ncbi:DUF5706 domain-containing protein [Roseiarcaceae bacterium H3SJ34-1]|uniref:Pycsar system effector family protein n=1 Tax=Terripilifer ovatus TaxID=3032367 RepID=UPI003AB9825D|nr:DUF5706 domain-containing protein [Roseiarcaceae bacterium H3SJ34-1]